MTDATTPAELLSVARGATLRTRRARRGFWFPLVLFGLIVLGATPFYRSTLPSGSTCTASGSNSGSDYGYFCFGRLPSHASLLSGPPDLDRTGATVYWLTAILLGYAATLAFYRWRGARVGVAGRILPYVLTGMVLLGLAVLTSPVIWWRLSLTQRVGLPPDLTIRGLLPLVVLALGLLVLAYSERSVPLGVFAACFLAVTLVSNLYDVENQTPRLGWTPSGTWSTLPNLWLSGFVLLLGGLGFGLQAFIARRSR
jgi:hypothetical protein